MRHMGRSAGRSLMALQLPQARHPRCPPQSEAGDVALGVEFVVVAAPMVLDGAMVRHRIAKLVLGPLTGMDRLQRAMARHRHLRHLLAAVVGEDAQELVLQGPIGVQRASPTVRDSAVANGASKMASKLGERQKGAQ